MLTLEWGSLKDGLFIFDNTPSHQKCAPDALSAHKMPKNPNKDWSHKKDGPRIQSGTFGPSGISQDFYFPEDHPTMAGWFQRMETIIQEWGLWLLKGLKAQCKGFKCKAGRTDCCCRCVMFCQLDFVAQKLHLEEYVTLRGHICDFYLKFHCELNFIEQYWGTVKFCYRSSPKTADMDAMECNVLTCLDDVPLLQIKHYANRSARFISAYSQGLLGTEAAWANRKYHGHRTLPPSMIAEVKKALSTWVYLHQEIGASLV
ncbi:hypothetical protein PILCRDRAFT_95554 [Piloderma croceum F 1598]|uniref:Uncharacterized protein n=1 Tax=Piloderma croceum (strain F 1598) TaxID=765440 RepID=A0A0C3BNZ3_PILCF|nr:hypothetical protein PILCRDRAFT_95554 [Piloderma croceum F 1598]